MNWSSHTFRECTKADIKVFCDFQIENLKYRYGVPTEQNSFAVERVLERQLRHALGLPAKAVAEESTMKGVDKSRFSCSGQEGVPARWATRANAYAADGNRGIPSADQTEYDYPIVMARPVVEVPDNDFCPKCTKLRCKDDDTLHRFDADDGLEQEEYDRCVKMLTEKQVLHCVNLGRTDCVLCVEMLGVHSH